VTQIDGACEQWDNRNNGDRSQQAFRHVRELYRSGYR
jgi:hypothetical protein